jgi:hypothetical protein
MRPGPTSKWLCKPGRERRIRRLAGDFFALDVHIPELLQQRLRAAVVLLHFRDLDFQLFDPLLTSQPGTESVIIYT